MHSLIFYARPEPKALDCLCVGVLTVEVPDHEILRGKSNRGAFVQMGAVYYRP